MVEIDTNVKDFTNRTNFGFIVCTSGTRPTAVDGKAIYETDTDKLLIYNGAAWAEITGGGGVTDHGALTGLTDDDHTQYVLVNGTRAMTGDLTIYKTNPYLYIKPTDASSPSVLLKDSADNIKGRMYVTGDDMVVRPDDGHLYLSTTVTTGGNVLLETKGVTRLTVADTSLTSTIPLAMGTNKITGLATGTTNGDALRYEQIADASFTNLLENGDFESWSAGTSSAPDGWTKDGTIARDGATKKIGTYSAKLTNIVATQAWIKFFGFDIGLNGKQVTTGCWAWSDTASRVRLTVYTPTTGDVHSSYHTG